MLPDHMEWRASLICKPQVTSISSKPITRKTPLHLLKTLSPIPQSQNESPPHLHKLLLPTSFQDNQQSCLQHQIAAARQGQAAQHF